METKKPISQKQPKPFKPKFNFYWIYLVLLLFFIGSLFWNPENIVREMSYSTFESVLRNGCVDKITVFANTNIVEAKIKPQCADSVFAEKFDKAANIPTAKVRILSADEFSKLISELQQNKIFTGEMVIEEGKDYWDIFLYSVLPFLLIILFFVFLSRRISGGANGGGICNVGKSQAQLFDKASSDIKISFKDVAGLAGAKQEVEEIVSFLKNPSKYTELGGKIPKGALLVGPPGTGKTLLAKAVAGEANVPFFTMSGSDFVEMFVRVGSSRVRDLFHQAKEKAPCIVFIDEIDAVGRARGKNANMASNDERENTLNQLLTEMDGFGSNSGVIILAATNRADILDKALLRAGRFDRQINVDLPELKERLAILKVHLKNLKVQKDFDKKFLAKQTPGFSGADIANVCNEAALIAARRNKECVERQDFLDAIDRIVGGLEKRSKIITPHEKRTIAFHEAGHATVSWMLPNANPLLKVTIIPRGKALGAAWYLPEERQITTTEQMMDEMASTMGGRAAEEIINGKISTGALSDLEKVTKQAYAMVSYFGMSDKVGNISYYDSQESGYNFNKPYSEKTAELIDTEAKKLIDRAHETALNVLRANMDGFTQLAQLLLSREVIFTEDLEKIFGQRAKSDEQIDEEKREKEADENAVETPNSEPESN